MTGLWASARTHTYIYIYIYIKQVAKQPAELVAQGVVILVATASTAPGLGVAIEGAPNRPKIGLQQSASECSKAVQKTARLGITWQ